MWVYTLLHHGTREAMLGIYSFPPWYQGDYAGYVPPSGTREATMLGMYHPQVPGRLSWCI